jgi:hypothetical protein
MPTQSRGHGTPQLACGGPLGPGPVVPPCASTCAGGLRPAEKQQMYKEVRFIFGNRFERASHEAGAG